ncbi:hypothetical protein [Chryseobacterium tongliaoense]|uniref:hypothetical protein n=1 Tax=Chryseobacterium tongliaoense TaxID=3240933 RepID=UPI003516CE89
MFSKWFLLTGLLFVFAKVSAQSSDGMRLNVRLYPTQVLSINSDIPDSDGNKARTDEQKFITVTSPSGFQVKAHYEIYDDEKPKTENIDDHIEYNLINRRKGAVQKMYNLNKSIEKRIKKLACDIPSQPNYLVLTLISQ